jgi:hypothetical protein
MLSRFINGILRRRPGMLGLVYLSGGTFSAGHRLLVHFQLATGGAFWVATEGNPNCRNLKRVPLRDSAEEFVMVPGSLTLAGVGGVALSKGTISQRCS